MKTGKLVNEIYAALEGRKEELKLNIQNSREYCLNNRNSVSEETIMTIWLLYEDLKELVGRLDLSKKH